MRRWIVLFLVLSLPGASLTDNLDYQELSKERTFLFRDFPLSKERLRYILSVFEPFYSYPFGLEREISYIQTLLRKGRFEKAIKKLEELRRRSPESKEVLLLLGDLYFYRGDFSSARQIYLEFLKLSPEHKEIAYQALEASIKNFEYKEALRIIDKYFPEEDFFILERKAEIYVYLNQIPRAIAVLKKGIKKFGYKDFYYFLGKLYKLKKAFPSAWHCFQKAFEEGSIRSLLELSRIAQYKGDYQEAINYLKKFIELKGENNFLLSKLAVLYTLSGKYGEAKSILKRILKDEPENEFARVFLSLLYSEEAQLDRSLFILLEGAYGGIDYPEFYTLICTYFIQEGYLGKNFGEHLKSLKLEEIEDEELLITGGIFFLKRKDYPQAQSFFSRAFKLNPLNPRLFFYLGVLNFYLKDYASSEYYFRRSLELSEEVNPQAFNFLSNIYLIRGQFSRAKSYIQRALREEPENGFFWDTLGWVYYKKGEYQQARVYLERALQLLSKQSKDDSEIREHLGDVYISLRKIKEARIQYLRAYELAEDEGRKSLLKEKLRVSAFNPFNR